MSNSNWSLTYKMNLDKKLNSELRSHNYKVLFDALYTKDKFKKDKNKRCPLCEKENENIVHIYTKCEYVNDIFKEICERNEIPRANNLEDIIFLKQDDKIMRKKISIFKLIIWKMRIRALNKQIYSKEIFYTFYKRYHSDNPMKDVEENM